MIYDNHKSKILKFPDLSVELLPHMVNRNICSLYSLAEFKPTALFLEAKSEERLRHY